MQIRKCVLIEMFSLVLIGMFSPFFHIIGSRIGAFGLHISIFGCSVSLQFWRDTHQRPTQNAASTHGPGCAERAVPHGWTRAERISRPTAQAPPKTAPAPDSQERARHEPGGGGAAADQARGGDGGRPPGGGAGATTGHRRVPGGAARPRPRLPATACARRARRAHRVRAAPPRDVGGGGGGRGGAANAGARRGRGQ